MNIAERIAARRLGDSWPLAPGTIQRMEQKVYFLDAHVKAVGQLLEEVAVNRIFVDHDIQDFHDSSVREVMEQTEKTSKTLKEISLLALALKQEVDHARAKLHNTYARPG